MKLLRMAQHSAVRLQPESSATTCTRRSRARHDRSLLRENFPFDWRNVGVDSEQSFLGSPVSTIRSARRVRHEVRRAKSPQFFLSSVPDIALRGPEPALPTHHHCVAGEPYTFM